MLRAARAKFVADGSAAEIDLDPDSPLPSLMGTYWFWYPALVLFPIVMLLRGLSGYLYTARVESVNFLHSLRLLFAVVLLNALVQRWLLVVRRRLAKEAALPQCGHRSGR